MRELQPLQWQVGAAPAADTIPARWIPAAVPGAVQLDFAAADGYPDYLLGPDVSAFDWMETSFFRYRAAVPPAPAGASAWFVTKGIDYRYDVLLNGVCLHRQEGMFSRLRLPLPLQAAENLLEVVVYPIPAKGTARSRDQAAASCKPAVSYGWDFHPRLVPSGIWDETGVEWVTDGCLTDMEAFFSLSGDCGTGQVRVEARADGGDAVRVTLRSPQGESVWEKALPLKDGLAVAECTLVSPALWWPNGHGDPALYTVCAVLLSGGREIDRRECSRGFRRVELVMYDGAWRDSIRGSQPMSRATPPMTLQVNGRAIFGKGTNWVCPAVFPGTLTERDYERQLTLVRDARMNLIRCWGGAVVNKECFYDLCDRYGLLVWQEFPLACNRYEGTPDYLEVLDTESAAIVRRLRRHTCLAVWCSGNELFNEWSRMTDQDLAIRLLNRNCLELDRDTPFLATSPVMGVGHGGYSFWWDPQNRRDVFACINAADNTAYTEFGCPSAAAPEVLREIIPPAEWNEIRKGTAWEYRFAVGAWKDASWMDQPVLEAYFGAGLSMEELAAASRFLQAAALQYIYEEARRQAPRCSMALNWCFNEPWACAANNSIVDFRGEPKPAYYAVRQALRPCLLSARIPRFSWKAGEMLSLEIWLLSEREEFALTGRVTVSVNGETAAQFEVAEPAAGNRLLGVCELTLSGREGPGLSIALEADEAPQLNNLYQLLLAGSETSREARTGMEYTFVTKLKEVVLCESMQ